MARSVTVQEFSDWFEKIKHRTWWCGRSDADGNQKIDLEAIRKRQMEVKYFYLSLDTRDGKIWHIKTREGLDTSVSESEKFDGTILELLERRMDERREEIAQKNDSASPDA